MSMLAAMERRHERGVRFKLTNIEESNHRHRRLLRARRERLCRRAIEQRDELASPHGPFLPRKPP